MLSFKITKCDLSNDDCFSPKRNYKLDISKGLEKDLNKIKSSQDVYYELPDFQKIIYIYDLFRQTKYTLKKKTNAQNISNAWLKMYEIIHQHKLIKKGQKKVVHFDNAAFPGSFILATNHYAKTIGKVKQYHWYGSSWIGYNQNLGTGELLEDKYNMYKKYPNRWLMNKEYDGNVNEIKNQMYWKKKLYNKVDLYSSDLGFETGEDGDYNKQEYTHVQPNIGQVLAGLLTLKKGGHLVTKQYTFFESLNISMYAVLTNLFKEVYICKPITSRPPNSETYIIGKGFLGPFKENSTGDKLIKLMENKISKFDRKPLVYKRCLTKEFLKSINNASNELFNRQITYIKNRLNFYDKVKELPKNIRKQKAREIVNEWKNDIVYTWKKENPIYKLSNSKKIRYIKEQ
jgi:23S rRNA U2552 (ribose-2'-O)-methylase RlmE/FtsJ